MQPALTTAIPARKFKLTLLGPAFIVTVHPDGIDRKK